MADPENPDGRAARSPHGDSANEPSQPDPSADSASSAITEAPDLPRPSPATSPSSADGAAQLAWLHRELDRQLSVYRARRKRDKRKAFALQMATVMLSATITVLLGLRITGTAQQLLADIALALGAIITVLAAAEAFFAHRGLWILRTHTVRRLEILARHLDYQQAESGGRPPQSAVLDRYATELDEILSEDYTRWQQLRATNPETRNPPKTANDASSSARET